MAVPGLALDAPVQTASGQVDLRRLMVSVSPFPKASQFNRFDERPLLFFQGSEPLKEEPGRRILARRPEDQVVAFYLDGRVELSVVSGGKEKGRGVVMDTGRDRGWPTMAGRQDAAEIDFKEAHRIAMDLGFAVFPPLPRLVGREAFRNVPDVTWGWRQDAWELLWQLCHLGAEVSGAEPDAKPYRVDATAFFWNDLRQDADYCQAIAPSEATSFDVIAQKLSRIAPEEGGYQDKEAFGQEVRRLFENARTYNTGQEAAGNREALKGAEVAERHFDELFKFVLDPPEPQHSEAPKHGAPPSSSSASTSVQTGLKRKASKLGKAVADGSETGPK